MIFQMLDSFYAYRFLNCSELTLKNSKQLIHSFLPSFFYNIGVIWLYHKLLTTLSFQRLSLHISGLLHIYFLGAHIETRIVSLKLSSGQ